MSCFVAKIRIFDNCTGALVFSGSLTDLIEKAFPGTDISSYELDVKSNCCDYKFLF